MQVHMPNHITNLAISSIYNETPEACSSWFLFKRFNSNRCRYGWGLNNHTIHNQVHIQRYENISQKETKKHI